MVLGNQSFWFFFALLVVFFCRVGCCVFLFVAAKLSIVRVSVFWQQVLIGSIIILAVYIDVLRRQFGTRR